MSANRLTTPSKATKRVAAFTAPERLIVRLGGYAVQDEFREFHQLSRRARAGRHTDIEDQSAAVDGDGRKGRPSGCDSGSQLGFVRSVEPDWTHRAFQIAVDVADRSRRVIGGEDIELDASHGR